MIHVLKVPGCCGSMVEALGPGWVLRSESRRGGASPKREEQMHQAGAWPQQDGGTQGNCEYSHGGSQDSKDEAGGAIKARECRIVN